jgi:hypothetical protein
MANLVISDELAERLRQLAARQRRPLEEILQEMMTQYEHDPLLVEVPESVQDKAAYLRALREVRPKIYAIARNYWRRVGDPERLALTDEQLDEQFWVIDPYGVPRLKSEQDTVQLPPDPLDEIVGLFADSDLTDMSTTVRETMKEHYRRKLSDQQ